MRTAVVVMGVAGSGKTTVAGQLARRLGWPLIEGDDLHPAGNVAKMAAGTPLTDADRVPWLAAVRDRISGSPTDVVVTCSALRRAYRDVLRQAKARVVFAYLEGPPAVIRSRMQAREGHFMPLSTADMPARYAPAGVAPEVTAR
jgi:gluconokinase